MVVKTQWAAPLAICCVLFTLLLISGTIVLALIPIYLTPKNMAAKTTQTKTFNAVFASDVMNGRSLTLSNQDDVSTQMSKNIPHSKGGSMKMQSGQFVSATAANKKKRQTSNITETCEQATGLYGDLFTTEYMLEYPLMYSSSGSQQRYLDKMQNAIRNEDQRTTVSMKFTNGETRNVQLAFCSFSTPAIPKTSNTSDTSNTLTSIYLLDQDSNFFRFNPTTFDVTFISTINCSTIAYPYSMALQRNGKAWTLFTDGNLYTFDINTTQCQNTSYVSEQEGLILFGMHFANDGSNNTEKLYITSDSSNPPYRLATIDVDTLEVTDIGYYYTISARAELTSTSDGKLFGLFEGAPYVIAEINRTNGEILSKTSQSMIQYTSDSSHFAFTSYLSDFFLFVGDSTYTDIFLYNSSTGITTKKKTISNGIVGAGVA